MTSQPNEEKKRTLLKEYLALRDAAHAALPGTIPYSVYAAAEDARLAKYHECIRNGWTVVDITKEEQQNPPPPLPVVKP